MRNSIRFAVVGAALAAVSFGSVANAATTATATATAEILSTLAIVNDSGLDFGTIAVAGAGTVKVSANGLSDSCTAIALICGGTRAPAGFTVSGNDGAGVAVTLPSSATLTYVGWVGAGAAPTMSVGSFTSYFPAGTTLVAGSTTVNVGGSLAVAAAQAPGTYSGTFDVSAQYQ